MNSQKPNIRYGFNLILLCFVLVLMGLSPISLKAQGPLPPEPPVRDLRFGVVQAYDTPELATAAGVGWTRVFFSWADLQPGGTRDWNEHYFLDKVPNRELNDGRQMVGLLIGTPYWAAGSRRGVPSGLYFHYNDPNNAWGQFVKQIVQRYRGRIDHWIIWNEPDIWNNSRGTMAWDGSVGDYAQLLKVGYQAAKSVNPNAVVAMAATTYWWDVEYKRELYLSKLLRAIKNDPESASYNGFFDVVALNLYYNPEQIHEIITTYRDELNKQGFGNKRVWLTETNAPPTNDPYHPASARFPITLEQQSNFLVQVWGMALAAGAERIEYYKMSDEQNLPSGLLPYGMRRKDGSLRPGFWTYRTIVTYLSQFQQARLSKEGDVRRVVLSRGHLGTTTIVWNTGWQSELVSVPATYGSALLVDPFGPRSVINPTNGRYTLRLPPTQHESMGGTPFMIVEGSGAQMMIERPNLPYVSIVQDPVVFNPPAPQPEPLPTPLPTAPPLPSVSPEPVPTAPPAPNRPPPASSEEWDIPNGRFFTQTGNGQGGFSVVDDAQARFWSEYLRLGGAQTVGYPISHRYTRDGFVTQAFQKLVLQWRPETGQVSPVNVFDELSKANFDAHLFSNSQVPRPLRPEEVDPPNGSWNEIVAQRHGLLADNPAIQSRYFSQSDPLTIFGLPTSRVEDMGSHYALRTQRAVFQQWKEEVPWASRWEVTIANGGDMAKQLGWLPVNVLQPERR